jgi:hypothetical protein
MANPVHRGVFRYQLRLDAVIDLRDSVNCDALGMPEHPARYMNPEIATWAASKLRKDTPAQAMLVPSVAFLDDFTRWNLVVFLEKVAGDTSSWITSVVPGGPLHWN